MTAVTAARGTRLAPALGLVFLERVVSRAADAANLAGQAVLAAAVVALLLAARRRVAPRP